MKQYAGLLFILFALFALYVYNTGRAAAVVGVLKDPNYKPPLTTGFAGDTGGSLGTAKKSGGSSTDWLGTVEGYAKKVFDAATGGLLGWLGVGK